MSSHLSSLDASSCFKFEESNLKDVEVFVDKEDQPWFNQAYIKSFLGMCNTDISTAKLSKDGKHMCASLESGSVYHRYNGKDSWSGPEGQQ